MAGDFFIYKMDHVQGISIHVSFLLELAILRNQVFLDYCLQKP